MRIAILALLLTSTGKLFSQSVFAITGPSLVAIGTQQTYVADLSGMLQTRGAVVTWSVQGGTIVSAVTDPTAAIVSCIVQWNYRTGTYTLSASVNMPGQSGNKQIVLLCQKPNAGRDITICPGDSVMIGAPAIPAFSYWWSSASLDNCNIAQPVAYPAQTTAYQLMMLPTPPNLLQNGDFENGYTGFGTDYPAYRGTIGVHGFQALTKNPQSLLPGWCNMPEYFNRGQVLVAEGTAVSDPGNYRFWYTTINVQPNTHYVLNFLGTSLSQDPCKMRLTFTGNNTGALPKDMTIPRYCNWNWGTQIAWYSDNNTRLTLDMKFPAPPVPGQYANEVAIDKIIFAQSSDCMYTGDTVIVSVVSSPSVSPAGPIEYYYLLKSGAPQIGITLTADAQASYQWYKDDVLISGATSQTYKAKSTGVYTVHGTGCLSEGVVFYEHAKSTDERTVIGEALDFPGGVHSPTYYCYNTAGYIQQFDLGPSANYYWETYTTGSTAPQLIVNSSTYDMHSPRTDVNIAGPQANPTTVLGYAEDNGFVKAMEFNNFYYSSYATASTTPTYVCPGASFKIRNDNSFTASLINPGSSWFDWETYDVGPNGEILTPDPTRYPDPADPLNTKKIRIRGKNGYTGLVTIRLNTLPAQVKKYFYSEDGGCYQDNKYYEADIGCMVSVTDQASLFPNPAKNTIMITSPDDILSVEIMGINHYTGQVPAGKKAGSRTLNLNISQYKPGIYNCKITTTSGVVNKKLIVSP